MFGQSATQTAPPSPAVAPATPLQVSSAPGQMRLTLAGSSILRMPVQIEAPALHQILFLMNQPEYPTTPHAPETCVLTLEQGIIENTIAHSLTIPACTAQRLHPSGFTQAQASRRLMQDVPS